MPVAAPTLETPRLVLRQFRESDLAALETFFADPVTRAVYRVTFTTGELWRRIATNLGHWQLRGFGPYVAEEKSTGDVVGMVSLWFPHGWADIEVGYGVLPAHRRKGYAAEAAARVRDHGFEIGIPRLVSYIQPTNLASIAVATSIGATPDGGFDMGGIPHTVYAHRRAARPGTTP